MTIYLTKIYHFFVYAMNEYLPNHFPLNRVCHKFNFLAEYRWFKFRVYFQCFPKWVPQNHSKVLIFLIKFNLKIFIKKIIFTILKIIFLKTLSVAFSWMHVLWQVWCSVKQQVLWCTGGKLDMMYCLKSYV